MEKETMSFSIFSLIVSILWCNVFTIILFLLLKKRKFLVYFSIYPLLFLVGTAILRLILNWEFPFTKIIRSSITFPAIVSFLEWQPLMSISASITIKVYDILLVIWVLGIIYSLLKILLQDLRFKKTFSKESETQNVHINSIMADISKWKIKKVKVIQTPLVVVPMITGIIDPTIYLPCMKFSDDQLYYILMHEFSHYVQKDLWIKMLIQIICAFYWWNPITYLLKYDLDYLLEVKTDLFLTQNMSKDKKLEYLNSILEVAKFLNKSKKIVPLQTSGLGLFGNFKKNNIKERFLFVIENHPTKCIPRMLLFYIPMLVLFIFSYSFVFQPYVGPPQQYINKAIYDISADDSYIIENKDNTYSLYINEQYITDVDVNMTPFSSLKIIESNEDE